MQREVVRTKNFVADAANFILDQAHEALGERNEFRIALSGGSTPRPFYTRLAAIARDLSWDRVLITFGDERCVSPDEVQSNYRMARESLFLPAAIPEKSIMRMRGEIEPQLPAEEYQDGLDLIDARQICFLVNASKGTDLIERALAGGERYPASRVQPAAGDISWIVDLTGN